MLSSRSSTAARDRQNVGFTRHGVVIRIGPPTIAARMLVIAFAIMSVTGCALTKQKIEDVISVDASGGRHRAQKLNNMGVEFVDSGRSILGFEKFKKAVSADQTFGPAHNNLGLIYFNRGNLYDAAVSFDRAAQFMPENPRVMYNMGMVMEAAGKFMDAIDYYSQAHEMAPANPMFLGNLVRTRIRVGKKDYSVREQLMQLVAIETRKEWLDWAEELLALDLNPWLDRGPPDPNLDALNEKDDKKPDPQPTVTAEGIELAPGEVLLHSEEIPKPQPEAILNEQPMRGGGPIPEAIELKLPNTQIP